MRLRDPQTGTVIHVDGDQAARYLARGWADLSKPVEAPKPVLIPQANPAPPRRGRPPKNNK